MSLFSGGSTVFGNDGAKNKKKRHYLCGKIMQSSSPQHSAGSFFFHHLRANHIPSEDFPTNFTDPPTSPQLIASGLKSPIMGSVPSVFQFWCFLIRVAVPSSEVSTERWVRNNLSLIRQHSTYGLLQHRNRGVAVYTVISPHKSDSEGGSGRPPTIISFLKEDKK